MNGSKLRIYVKSKIKNFKRSKKNLKITVKIKDYFVYLTFLKNNI